MTTSLEREISAEQLHRLLARWQADGLLDATEVARIEEAEARRGATRAGVQPTRPGVRVTGSLIAEGLGYAGAALFVAAVGRLIGPHWSDLSLGVQVLLAAVATAALLAAGFVVPESLEAPGQRLRAMLWAGSTALGFGTWAIAAGRWFGWETREVLAFAAALTTAQALLLWQRSRHLPQHLVAFAVIAVLVGALSTYLPAVGHHSAAAVAVACLGAAWVLLGQRGVVQPQLTAYLLGSTAAVLSAQTTTQWKWGAIFALVLTAAVITLAVWRHSLALLGVGTYALLTSVLAAAERFFPGSAGTTVALMLAGAVLVICALWTARRGRAGRPRRSGGTDE
jgi:hypothetical protein